MNPMEQVWEQVAQPDDNGKKCIRYKSDRDLLFLYANGFVDFRKYTLTDWINAFAESRAQNGSYRVTKAQWIAKEKYRLNVPITDPFDPMRLKEREFTEAEFRVVLRRYLCPSTWIPESSIPSILNHYRKQKQLLNGKIKIDKGIKKELQECLERIPSPLRMLQLDVARIRKSGKFKPAVAARTGYAVGPALSINGTGQGPQRGPRRRRPLKRTQEEASDPEPGIISEPPRNSSSSFSSSRIFLSRSRICSDRNKAGIS